MLRGWGGRWELDQYLGISEPLRAWNPDPVEDNVILKYSIICLGHDYLFYYPV